MVLFSELASGRFTASRIEDYKLYHLHFSKILMLFFFNLSSVFQVGFFPKDYVREVPDSYNFHMD
jgi:hypothetical protein